MRKLVRFSKAMTSSIGDYIMQHPYWVGGIIGTIVVKAIVTFRNFEKEV